MTQGVVALALFAAILAGCQVRSPGRTDQPLPPPQPGAVAPRPAVPPPARQPSVQDEADEPAVVAQAAPAPARRAARWTSYKQIQFEPGQAEVRPEDGRMIQDIAGYLARNPALRVGLDGSDTRDAALASRRVSAAREALVRAGVPSERIQTGALGGSRIARDRRVEVLLLNP